MNSEAPSLFSNRPIKQAHEVVCHENVFRQECPTSVEHTIRLKGILARKRFRDKQLRDLLEKREGASLFIVCTPQKQWIHLLIVNTTSSVGHGLRNYCWIIINFLTCLLHAVKKKKNRSVLHGAATGFWSVQSRDHTKHMKQIAITCKFSLGRGGGGGGGG